MTAAEPLSTDHPRLLIQPERPADAAAIDALVLRAFGPGRFAKTAERLRERAEQAAGFAAWSGGELIGSVRMWHIRAGDLACLFLGPIAVEREARESGVGARLVQACVDQARDERAAGILLVGDPPYFSRFGFGETTQVQLSGPVDPRRLLWFPITCGAPQGRVTAVI